MKDHHAQSDYNLPYTWHGPFAYSPRCSQCRFEVPHTQAQHDALRFAYNLMADEEAK